MLKPFNVKFVTPNVQELRNIGFDSSYVNQGLKKHSFLSFKICGLNCAQANILKQTAISVGSDCAVHKEVITGKIEKSDCILSGSVNELVKISEKLNFQPFGLKKLGQQLLSLVNPSEKQIVLKNASVDLKTPLLMGILNVTPDSFSDGGLYNSVDTAVECFKSLVEFGADIVDIGGESTRPGSETIDVDVEIDRVVPILRAIKQFDYQIPISIDTRNAKTADVCLQEGADIINDISALEWDSDMISVVKNHNCPVILTHSQDVSNSGDAVSSIYDYFDKKLDYILSQGIELNKVVLDPGLGFGKKLEQNWEIVKRLNEFTSLGCPILVGHSRKSFLKNVVDSIDNCVLDDATLLVSQMLIERGADIIRIHNVKKHSLLKKISL